MRYRNLTAIAPIIVTSWCLSLASCSDDGAKTQKPDAGAQPDVVSDTTTTPDSVSPEDIRQPPDAGDDPLAPTPEQPGLSPDGHSDVDTPLDAGQVRAGRITGPDTGFQGAWSHCRTGDFKLYNADIHVCIQAESTNFFEFFSGGMIVDAHRVGGPAEDVFGMLRPLVGLGTAMAQKVEVVRDGSLGGEAVIRVHARDIGIAHIYGLLGQRLNTPLGIEITTEFRLRADSDTVEMVSWYHNPTSGKRNFEAGDWFGFGDRTTLYAPGQGPGAPAADYPWLAALADGHAYGWVLESDDIASDLGIAALDIPWAGGNAKRFNLSPDETQTFRRWFVVGDGTLARIQERAAELRGESHTQLRRTLRVRTEAGDPLAGHRVEVTQDDTHVGLGFTDADGLVDLSLDPGTYDLKVQGYAAGADFQRTLNIADIPADAYDISIDNPAVLNLLVTGEAIDEPVTGRVVIQGGKGWSGVALHGELSLKIAPGTYTVTASHGTEYDINYDTVTLDAGTSTNLHLAVTRAFDTDGWVSADFHQHMEPSIDSSVTLEDRLLENASVGVEIVVPTDHEVITDLRPIIQKFGLSDVITSFPGAEVSPIETHIGMYPMEQDKSKRGNGSIQLAVLDENGEETKRLIPEVVQLARALPNDPVLQLNHARNSSSGMFTTVGFDPEVGPQAVVDNRFTIDFDALEIINRYRDTCKLMADWSGLLNYGVRITGLGNSDTHGLSGETGLPRNFLRIEKAVADVEPDDVRQAIRNGRVTVGSHAFIDFSDGKLPGDSFNISAGDSITFGVRVQSAAWAQAHKLVAVVNGEVVAEFDRPAEATDYLDFDQTITLPFERDSWVVFFAWGPTPAGPTGSGKPVIAFTNPLFVTTGADGADFQPPGVRPLSLGALQPLCD